MLSDERSTPGVDDPGSYDPDAFNELHADRRFVRAIVDRRNRLSAIDQAIALIASHPDADPIIRGDVIAALRTIDRRSL